MDRIIELMRIMKDNHSTDIIYFERIIEDETKKPLEIFIENDKIKLYHKVTGSDRGFYIPSERFTQLADAFIEYNRPSLRLYQVDDIKRVFDNFGVKKLF